jgi:serine/threonine protein kinase
MGSCFSDCYDAYFASEYQAIPEDVAEERDRSCSSITTGTYHSEGNLWSDAGNTDFVLPSEFSKFYILGELVGIGTTSKVYKVIPKRGGKAMTDCQPLACKIIDKRGLTNDIDYDDVDPLLEQLCREVEILRRIHHENIVTFYDYTETKDKLFIITERLDGGELFEYILNNGPLNEEFACRMLHGVFSAVAYLHERGVVHRDIKAENLIFCKDSSGQDSLKLIDFGFSTVLRHQMTGSFMGTGGYIAPEIRQNKSYSNSVDSWSLGVLVYCTLSARLPFGISIDALPSSIDQCRGIFDLTFPAKHWANVSPECKDLVTRLLEIDPNKRLTARGALNHAWVSEQCLHVLSMKLSQFP